MNAPALDGRVRELEAERDALRSFAQKIMESWPDGDVHGGDLQQYAEECGLLTMEVVNAPCGEFCECAAACGPDDFADGVECYRRTKLLTGSA